MNDEEANKLSSITNVVNIEQARKSLGGQSVKGISDRLEAGFGAADIQEMNRNHAFICNIGGKPYVMCDKYDEVSGRMVQEFVVPDAIKMRYSNKAVYVGEKIISLGKYWIEHEKRRTYDSIMFDPSKPREYQPEGCEHPVLNLWEDLAIQEKKGSWKLMRTHIWKILCNKDKVKFKYVIRWLAWTMQNVDKRAEVALIIKGKQGAGKGILFSQFRHIFGTHFMNIASAEHLTGRFNHHLHKCIFLFADEAYDPKDRESEGKLKQLITEDTIPIEAKFRDTVIAKNRLHIVMATNNDRVIVAGDDARRFFINECDNTWAKGQGKSDREIKQYFTPIWGEMNMGGREAMLYDLRRIKLGDWHPRHNIPETDEMKVQRRLQFSVENAVLDYLENGVLPCEKPDKMGHYIVKSSVLEKHMRDTIPSLKDPKIINWKKIMGVFNKLGISIEERTIRRLSDGNHFTFPPLHELRGKWDKAYHSYPGDWKELTKTEVMDAKDIELYNASRNWVLAKDNF